MIIEALNSFVPWRRRPYRTVRPFPLAAKNLGRAAPTPRLNCLVPTAHGRGHETRWQTRSIQTIKRPSSIAGAANDGLSLSRGFGAKDKPSLDTFCTASQLETASDAYRRTTNE